MIKSFFLSFLLLITIPLSQARILDGKGNIVPCVLEIVDHFCTSKTECSFRNLSALNAYAQKHFLRPKGTERLDKEAISHYKKLCGHLSLGEKEKLFGIFSTLGYVSKVYPPHKEYDYICLQGATVPTMRQRIMFLARLVNEKKLTITPKTKIVFLVGERELFPSETAEVLLDTTPWEANPIWRAPDKLPVNEKEAAIFIWEQLNLPTILREKSVLFIDGKKQAGQTRAQTIDAALEWMETQSVQGRVFMISSNPYIPYQETVMKYAIKKVGKEGLIEVEGGGCKTFLGKADIDVRLGLILDTFAREIYAETQILDLSQARNLISAGGS